MSTGFVLAPEEIERLQRRLERERRARLEAESLAEKGTRQLYERQRELALLHKIADAANGASIEEAIQITLDEVCAYMEWPVGHAYLAAPNAPLQLVSASLWHLESSARLESFRRLTEAITFTPGIGLPGRVLERRCSVWIEDVTLDPNFPRIHAAAAAGLRGALGLPVIAGDQVVAVLEFFCRDCAVCDETQTHIAQQVGLQLGRAFERAQAARALRESEERFRQVVENISEAFWMTDADGRRTLYVSPRYAEIWGQSIASLQERPDAWQDSVHPDDRERVRRPAAEVSFRLARADGTQRSVRMRRFTVPDATGQPYRQVLVAEDVTERKKLEEQFLRAQRVDAIGTLASGIAHDLNNILTPVLIAATLLKDEVTEGRGFELAAMIENSTRRGAGIVKQLLIFSRGAEGRRGPVHPSALLKEVYQLISETFPRSIAVGLKVPNQAPFLVAEATQLHQVLVNLCVNARDAMPEGGQLTLAAESCRLSAEDLHLHPEAKPGPYIVLAVTDTGGGIPPEIITKVFDPFFTTKEIGKGTGLGLSSVAGIVRTHGGFVTVYSEVGRGTTFRVYLPASNNGEKSDHIAKPDEKLHGNGELILLVDDEVVVRNAVKMLLEGARYRVLVAANGREALSRYMERQDEIALVLTDMMMPIMNGASLARALRLVDPNVRLIAASGLVDDAKRAELAALGVHHLLSKPAAPAEVLAAVREALA